MKTKLAIPGRQVLPSPKISRRLGLQETTAGGLLNTPAKSSHWACQADWDALGGEFINPSSPPAPDLLDLTVVT